MALSKLVKLAMKGATKPKKLPKKSLDIPEGVQENIGDSEEIKDFLGKRTISDIDIEDIRTGGLPDSPANLPGYPQQPALLRPKHNQELASFNPYIDETQNGVSPFVDLESIKAIRRAGADISMADVKKYIELQKKYRPGYNLKPRRKPNSRKIVDFEIENGLTELERKQLEAINNKMIEADKPIKDRAMFIRMANMTDQEIFIDAKGMQSLSDEFGMDDFDINEYIKESMDLRNGAILELEEMGFIKPTTDTIQRTEPRPSAVPTPANERKKGGRVERNPYGDYRRLI